jgi:hypothetical protein
MDDPVCTVSYDPQVPCVVMEWNGYATSRQFRDANERVLDAVVRHRASKMLTDVRNFRLIHGEDQDWLNRDWIPRAIDAGMRVCALVTPVFYFNKVAVETVTQRLDPARLRVHFFENREAARRWLLTV